MNVSDTISEFYSKTPFPDFDLNRFNSKYDLIYHASSFAKTLDRSIPTGASILDVGCGTGQLSAFLSLRRKNVWGIDFSEGSLEKANALKRKLNLDTLVLRKIDVTDSKQISNIGMKFDYVLCLGVLHHVKDSRAAFQNILGSLNNKGYIALGLYNTIGRILLKIRKLLAKSVFKDNELIKDWFIRMQIDDIDDKERTKGWWTDQYQNPFEKTFTVGDVLKWFKTFDIEYYQSIPSLVPFDISDSQISGVWNKHYEGYPFFPIRFYKQITWCWKIHKEGGYWITFGRKYV